MSVLTIRLGKRAFADILSLSLDEATSALDATSRILVFEAIKKWRKARTTIVITHDLSQIQDTDFVYLMKDGRVVEHGFRSDLIAKENSEFGIMATIQAQVPFPSMDRDPWEAADNLEIMVEDDLPVRPGYLSNLRPGSRQSLRLSHRQSVYQSNGYATYLDLLSDYQRNSIIEDKAAKRMSMSTPPSKRLSQRLSFSGEPRKLSSPFQIPRPVSSQERSNQVELLTDDESENFVSILEKKTGHLTPRTPSPRSNSRKHWDSEEDLQVKIVTGDDDMVNKPGVDVFVQPSLAPPSIFSLLRRHLPHVPRKWLGVIGIAAAIGHGILTPFWSKEIALLMATVSGGGDNKRYIANLSVRILGITIADAFCVGAQSFFLEKLAGDWIKGLREQVFSLVMAQPQAWFDRRENGSSRLVHILIKDAEDMKPMVSTIVGHSFMVVVMIVTGISWAMAIGWKLTMVGLAVAPIFAIIAIGSSRVLGVLEARNKLCREQVARTFYEVCRACLMKAEWDTKS